jgi:hypothetical protein
MYSLIMSRPELQNPPQLYYDEKVNLKRIFPDKTSLCGSS